MLIKPDFKNFTKKQSCLFGAMLGDILGAGFEFKTPRQIKENLITNPMSITDTYHTYGSNIGEYTDDFSQTLCVEECLNNDELNFNDELVLWMNGKYWANGQLFDIGNQTAKGIKFYQSSKCIVHQPYGSGNGAIMRIAPIAFDIRMSEDVIRQYCQITHNSDTSLRTAYAYIVLLVMLRVGEYDGKMLPFNEYFDEAMDSYNIVLPETPNLGNGYVLDTLASIKHCMNKATNFEEAITEAIKLGNDTDTTSSCVGAVVALYFGLNDIPVEWLEYIQPSLQNRYVKDMFNL